MFQEVKTHRQFQPPEAEAMFFHLWETQGYHEEALHFLPYPFPYYGKDRFPVLPYLP